MRSTFHGFKNLLGRAPVQYTRSESLPGFPLAWGSDRTAQLQAVGANGTLFAVVNRISTAAGQAEWKFYKRARSGKDEDRTEVTSHLALDIWNNPNSYYTQQEFVETFEQHLELTGEAWWLVGYDSRAASLPLELWPVRPDRMSPVPHPTQYLTGYVYRDPDGHPIPLGLNEAIQIAMPNPLDPYRGLGPVQSILTDVDAARYSAEWNRQFFYNSAEPGGIIEVDRRLSDPEFDEMSERWREQHRGIRNSHRVAILEQGRWVDRKYTQRDMQFSELRQLSGDVIREAFGVHKHMIGGSEDVNRANAEAAQATFDKLITVPRLRRIRGKLNGPFLRLFGPDVARQYMFDFEDPVLADSEAEARQRDSKAKAFQIYVQAGFDRDSVAQALEIPPMDAAETPPPAPPVAPPGAPQQPPGPQPPAGPPQPGNSYPDGPFGDTWGGGPLAEAFRVYVDGPFGDQAPSHRRAFLGEANMDPKDLPDMSHVKDEFEAAMGRLMDQWGRLSEDIKQRLVDEVARIAESGGLEQLAHLTVDTSAAADALTDAMANLGAIAGRQAAGEATAQGAEAGAAIPSRAEVGKVATVVTALLGQELAVSAARAAMRANGPDVTVEQIREAVRTWLAGLSDANAETQMGGALWGTVNTARVDTFSAAKPEGALYASEVLDINTCGPCRHVNGRWLGNTSDMAMVEQTYPSGAYGGYVDCEGGPRCRGTVVGVWRSATTDQ